MKRDNFYKAKEKKQSLKDSKESKPKEPEIFFHKIFSKIPTLLPYKEETLIDILLKKDKFTEHGKIDYEREYYILNNMFIIMNHLIDNECPSSFFPIVYLSTKVSDMLMYLCRKEKINERRYQLIYFSSATTAAKYETQCFIPYSFLEDIYESLVTAEEIKEVERNINRIFDFDLNIIYPTDVLCLYQLADKTNENKGLTQFCRFLLIFLLFSKSFIEKERNLVVLTVYYYAKIMIEKKMVWSLDLQFLSGIEKKTIIQNLKELNKEIKENNKIYNFLINHFFDII